MNNNWIVDQICQEHIWKIILSILNPLDFARLIQVHPRINKISKDVLLCKEYNHNWKEFIVALNRKNLSINNLMNLSARYGNKEIFDFMIKKGAKYWELCLSYACKGGNNEIIDFLLHKKCIIKKLKKSGGLYGNDHTIIEYVDNIFCTRNFLNVKLFLDNLISLKYHKMEINYILCHIEYFTEYCLDGFNESLFNNEDTYELNNYILNDISDINLISETQRMYIIGNLLYTSCIYDHRDIIEKIYLNIVNSINELDNLYYCKIIVIRGLMGACYSNNYELTEYILNKGIIHKSDVKPYMIKYINENCNNQVLKLIYNKLNIN